MNIRVMKNYKESIHNVRSHKQEWMKVAFGPILLVVLGGILASLAYLLYGAPFELNIESGKIFFTGEISAFFIFSHVAFGILTFIAWFSLYINGYRYAILQEGGDRWITLNLNMRFVKMVLYAILFSILCNLYLWVSAGIVGGAGYAFDNMWVNIILGVLLYLFGIYLFLRLFLYPAVISIDQSSPFRTSWNLTKDNVLRLLGLLILMWLTIAFVGIVGSIVLGLISTLLALISPLLGVLSLILWALFGIFMIVFTWAFSSKIMGQAYLELSSSDIVT